MSCFLCSFSDIKMDLQTQDLEFTFPALVLVVLTFIEFSGLALFRDHALTVDTPPSKELLLSLLGITYSLHQSKKI